MCDTGSCKIWRAVFHTPLPLVNKKSSFKDDIYERFRANLFTLRQPVTCSNYLPLFFFPFFFALRRSGMFKFPVCPMRIGAVCLLNLCLKNVTFDWCGALSHPVAHIQCGPVWRVSAEEVSVITAACTIFCTYPQTVLFFHRPPTQYTATFQTVLHSTTANHIPKSNYIWMEMIACLPSVPENIAKFLS